jgi:hypothetical protein
MANQTQTAVPKIKLKPKLKSTLALVSKPDPKPVLSDGHVDAKLVSPRFNDTLDVQFILVNTSYNNRLLADKDMCQQLVSQMGDFQCEDEDEDDDEETQDTEIRLPTGSSTYIIPNNDNLQLLYTVHSGYTWIDEAQAQLKVYLNANEDISIVRKQLSDHNLSDVGCFVFKLRSLRKVKFASMLDFVSRLTEIKFCAFFHLGTLYSVEYSPDLKAIKFSFDTESG